MQLVIGNKNYSSWSLRPWLLLSAFDVSFDEQWVSLQEPCLAERLAAFSDSARVPVLNDGDISVWDSLAICEYVNEVHLKGIGLPFNVTDRATARSVSAEMHSGFSALRNEMPMNIRASRVIEPSKECLKDIARIDQIWSDYARENSNGDLRLFGEFGIPDCMFAPVVMRFKTYQPTLSKSAHDYMASMLEHPALKQWIKEASRETEVVEVDEAGVER